MNTVRRVLLAWSCLAFVALCALGAYDWSRGGNTYRWTDPRLQTTSSWEDPAIKYAKRDHPETLRKTFRRNRVGTVFEWVSTDWVQKTELPEGCKKTGGYEMASRHLRAYVTLASVLLFCGVTGLAIPSNRKSKGTGDA